MDNDELLPRSPEREGPIHQACGQVFLLLRRQVSSALTGAGGPPWDHSLFSCNPTHLFLLSVMILVLLAPKQKETSLRPNKKGFRQESLPLLHVTC